MRERKEIMNELDKAYEGTMSIAEKWIYRSLKLQLEVLLDIRKIVSYQLTDKQLAEIYKHAEKREKG